MSPLARILIGFLVSGLGVLMTIKTEWFMYMVGEVQFAQRMFGGGGTRFFLKLFGMFITIIGFLVITNLFDNVVGGFIQRILP